MKFQVKHSCQEYFMSDAVNIILYHILSCILLVVLMMLSSITGFMINVKTATITPLGSYEFSC